MATLTTADIKRPSQRDAISTLDVDDVIVVEDISESKIKQITKANLKITLGISDIESDISDLDSTKADKVSGATENNFAGLDSNGNLIDSGHKDSDYEDADATILKQANVVDALNSTSTVYPLSANQGKALKDAADGLAGVGRTTETVKGNADAIDDIKGTGWTDSDNLVAHGGRMADIELSATTITSRVVNLETSVSESILQNSEEAWEFGTLSSGEEVSSTIRIRTVDFISVTPSTKYLLKFLNVFLDFQITQYGTFSAGSGADFYITNSAYLSTDTELTLNAACTKIRVVARPHTGSIEGMSIASIMALTGFLLLPMISDKQIKLKVMSHNVGTYSYGISPQGIPDVDIDEKKILWRKMIARNNCDFIGVQEFKTNIDVSNSLDTISTIYNFPYTYTVGDYSYQFLASRYHLMKTARKQLADGTYRYYSKAYITVDGVEVCMVNTHLQSGDNASIRASEIAEILAAVSSESYVVIMGDFNVSTKSELETFTTAGFKLANSGWFGDFLTYPYSAPANLYDNIIVSENIRIDNVYIDENITSDHFPIIAELSIIKKV